METEDFSFLLNEKIPAGEVSQGDQSAVAEVVGVRMAFGRVVLVHLKKATSSGLKTRNPDGIECRDK